MASVVVRRAEDRFETSAHGVLTRHTFSFGTHFDPARTGFGALVAHNEEHLDPGAGYNSHRHAALDIVSWVIEGELTHVDSTGALPVARTVTRAGGLQHLRAGVGVEHSERNEGDRPLRFVQMWLVGDPDAEPAYEQQTGSVLRLDHAALRVQRLLTQEAFRLPEAAFVHVSVVRGSLDLDGPDRDVPDLDNTVRVHGGDTVHLTGGGGTITAVAESAVLVWEMEER